MMAPEEELIVSKLALNLLICVNAVMREEGDQMKQRIRSLASRLFKERRAAVLSERERIIALCEQEARRYGAMDAPDQARADFLAGAQHAVLLLGSKIGE